MKVKALFAFFVMLLLPLYFFAQDQASPYVPKQPELKTQVILKEGTSATPHTFEPAPENVLKTSSKPIPGPVMRSAALPKLSLDDHILKLERQLDGLSDEYREAHPDIVNDLKSLIERKKQVKSRRDRAMESHPVKKSDYQKLND